MGRVTVAVIVSLWVIPLSIMVNHIVPEPYMDEIFHIPQAQQYCKGNFNSWDPMITTPPGLYYLSLAHVASFFPGMWFVKAVSSFSELCSIPILRSVNGLLGIICSVLVYEILAQLRPALDDRKRTFYAVVLALYPLHWFFTFLYYTDVASLSAVLSMYLACLKRHYHFSALLGILAILIRQTNVIWMLFVACIEAINFVLAPVLKDKVQPDNSDISTRKSDGLADKKSISVGPQLRKRKTDGIIDAGDHSLSKMSSYSLSQTSGLLDEVQAILLRFWHLKWKVVVLFGPFFLVSVAFVTFVLWNGSVVLGAKEAHTVSPHFAQIMYFGLFSALAMAPLHFSLGQATHLFWLFWKNKPLSFIQAFMVLAAGFLSVHFFSIAHPYLLADNRHYPFYIWRKVIKAHWLMKYILVPLYVYSWISIISILRKSLKKIWVLVFFLACAAVLVPAPLIEFRYFTIPFFFLVLHSHINDNKIWILMAILYLSVNIFTMFMFLFRPFHWDHEQGIQRFIW